MSKAQSSRAETLLALARDALRQNRRAEAFDLARRARETDPQLEGAYLILAALSAPAESIRLLNQALKINPNSSAARKGMHWAVQRLRKKPKGALPSKQNPSGWLRITRRSWKQPTRTRSSLICKSPSRPSRMRKQRSP
jgi:tetratricopeptide (TPR) repeat protein